VAAARPRGQQQAQRCNSLAYLFEVVLDSSCRWWRQVRPAEGGTELQERINVILRKTNVRPDIK
jgi:hypothetical protein